MNAMHPMHPRPAVPFDVRLMNQTAALLFLVVLTLALWAASRWVLRHPAFDIQAIELRTPLTHSNELTLRANVTPHLQGTFFTLDLARAKATFEAAPWVRTAVVRRQFPNRLSVTLEEHQAVALWGDAAEPRLVNSFGEVFEANTGEVDAESLPLLVGPEEQSAQVLALYRLLAPQFQAKDMLLVRLTLTPRGNWRAELDSGAQLELGHGSPQEVAAHSGAFLRTATQVVSSFSRRMEAIESVDLRYAQGYAMRLRGVSTLEPSAQTGVPAGMQPAIPLQRP